MPPRVLHAVETDHAQVAGDLDAGPPGRLVDADCLQVVTGDDPPPPGGCTATYSLVNSWPGGFQASLTVQNGSSPRTSWQVSFTLPGGQAVTQLWNASYTVSGSTVTSRNLSYNGTLAASASTCFRFTGGSTGAGGNPTGLTCQ